MSGVHGRKPSIFRRSIAKDEHSSGGDVGSFAVKEPARALARRLLRLHARDVRIRRPVRATPATKRLRDTGSAKAKTPIAVHGGKTPGRALLRGLQALFHSSKLGLESNKKVSIKQI